MGVNQISMKHATLAATLLVAACASAQAQPQADPAGCMPAGYDRARLETLRAAEFAIADADEREAFATAIAACVASPNPFLRDQIAYEGLTRMLRGEQLSVALRTQLTNDMLARMRAEVNGKPLLDSRLAGNEFRFPRENFRQALRIGHLVEAPASGIRNHSQ
jgi:hypothetical protein